MWGNEQTQLFNQLTPEFILDSVEQAGLRSTGRYMPLNSMENRVFDLEIDQIVDGKSFVVAKFYRPGRWSKEQIQEEHDFIWELKNQEIPVIAPLKFEDKTLFHLDQLGLMFCLYPKQGGRIPQELKEEQLFQMGRLLARMHNVGSSKNFKHRLTLNVSTYAHNNLEMILKTDLIPLTYVESYKLIVNQLSDLIGPLLSSFKTQRVHGDCHINNILTQGDNFFIVDFDDAVTAPCVQDIWALIPGRDQEAVAQRSKLLEGYQMMRDFDYSSLKLIEPLRALRMIHFNTWIAMRWQDLGFQRSFITFNTDRYWQEQLFSLREILSIMQTPQDYY